jgi:branched-chain amino acid transport system permease protein
MSRTARRVVGTGMVALGLAVVPLFSGSGSFVLQELESVLSLVLVAIGLNIVTGYAGQLTLGPGATFAAAGYAAIVLADHFPRTVGLFPMCLAGMAASVVVGGILGMPALRIGGFYLAMVTLFAALLIPTLAGNLAITGKNNGISLVSNVNFAQHPSGAWLYEVSVAVVLLFTGGSYLLLHSRMGHRFLVLRTSEELASALGISTYRAKLGAFLVSSLPAGVGGAFFAYTQQFMSPGSVTSNTSIYLLAACVIGGFGTVMGPVVGGLLVIGLSTFSGGLAQQQGIIFGGLLLVFSLVLPEGLLGIADRLPGITPALRNALSSLPLPLPIAARQGQHGSAPSPRDDAPVPTAALAPAPRSAVHGWLPSSGSARGCLEVVNATRRFGGVVAVDGVDLAIVQGTTHGLIGSNGSGKTTLLNLISGFYVLHAGEVRIDGKRLSGKGRARVAARGVARTFQTPVLVDELTVFGAEAAHGGGDLASLLRTPRGRRDRARTREEAEACLELLGLGAVSGTRAADLPHGMRRLVEVARAVALRPRFLLLDEPAAGLSEAELQHLRTTLVALRDAGMGILLVEHNVPLVVDVCDKATVLHLGRVLAEGPPQQVLERAEVALSFLGADEPLDGLAEQATTP